jgi:hypothetical protein
MRRSLLFTTRASVELRVKREVWWTTIVLTSLPGRRTSSSICRKTRRFGFTPELPGSTYSRSIVTSWRWA